MRSDIAVANVFAERRVGLFGVDAIGGDELGRVTVHCRRIGWDRDLVIYKHAERRAYGNETLKALSCYFNDMDGSP